jgi:hypothetical protein
VTISISTVSPTLVSISIMKTTTSAVFLSLVVTVTGLASVPPPATSSTTNNGQAYFAPPSATGGMAPMSIAKDPMAVLGKQWTSNMDRKVKHNHSTADSATAVPTDAIQFYGQENQANGRGGRGPLGKEWTSTMDMKAAKQAQEELHIKPYGLDHQANGQGGRSPLGKVRRTNHACALALWSDATCNT